MLAVIMAGGLGTRMNLGEKPLICVNGIPMLSYVHSAFIDAGCDVITVVTPKVPMTKNWCRVNGIETYNAKGQGYVEDFVDCVTELEEDKPIFSAVADLPGVTPKIIKSIHEIYENSGKPAASVWVPRVMFEKNNCKCSYSRMIDGVCVSPVGLNILDGADIESEQDEIAVVLDEPALTFNVNTPEELKLAEDFFKNNS